MAEVAPSRITLQNSQTSMHMQDGDQIMIAHDCIGKNLILIIYYQSIFSYLTNSFLLTPLILTIIQKCHLSELSTQFPTLNISIKF